jgi:hypothetical protein
MWLTCQDTWTTVTAELYANSLYTTAEDVTLKCAVVQMMVLVQLAVTWSFGYLRSSRQPQVAWCANSLYTMLNMGCNTSMLGVRGCSWSAPAHQQL